MRNQELIEEKREEEIKKILSGYDLKKACEELMVFGCIINIEKYKLHDK